MTTLLNTDFGFQVTESRLDELDLAALARASHCGGQASGRVLDMGCGVGAMSVAFAQRGAQVVAVDRQDFAAILRARVAPSLAKAIDFRCAIVPQCLDDLRVAGPWSIIYSQRMLHYLTHAQALATLTELRKQSRPGGMLFLGVSGMLSELGNGYPGAFSPVESRFAELHEHRMTAHGITQPVCLYRPEELARLVGNSGFSVKRVWLSPFGNVKLEAEVTGGTYGSG